MKVLNHPMMSALALSMFCSLSMIAALVSPEHIWVYHHIGSPTPIFGGVILYFAITWAVFALVLLIARRFRTAQLLVWTGIVCLMPYVLVQQLQQMQAIKSRHQLTHVLFGVGVTAWFVWVWNWRRVSEPVFERMHGLLASILGFAAAGSVLTLVQLAWCYDQALAIERPPVLHQRSAQVAYHGSPHQRVIWIVLDELSYDQVYGNRYPGLNLPEFDSLSKQSVLFTQVKPASNETRIALPAMLTGQPLEDIHASATGASVKLLLAPAGKPVPLRPQDSVFADALAIGDTTGVVGWYNPYCRLLGPVLDRCFQRDSDDFQDMSPRGTVLANAIVPVQAFLRKLAAPLSSERREYQQIAQVRAERISDYKALVASGDSLLTDPSIDLKFLHMPFPHPPGYYDRNTGQFTTGPATYLDNLELADRYLQHVRELLTAQGEWDSDVILITGDHSWRTTLLWIGAVDWTPEEQRASKGAFDTRPAWILKLPHQQASARIDSPVNAIITRSLVRNLLSGNVKTASDVAAFTEGVLPHHNQRDDGRSSADLHQQQQIAHKRSAAAE